jgi:cbb3-type cytochrome oxidase subunit 3
MSDVAWIGLYKFARLAFVAIGLVAIALYLYRPSRRRRLEEPARRMLEEDDS